MWILDRPASFGPVPIEPNTLVAMTSLSRFPRALSQRPTTDSAAPLL
jgi:hypothetical protein